MGGDDGEGGAASQAFRLYNQPFRQLSVTLSHALPHQGGGITYYSLPQGGGIKSL